MASTAPTATGSEATTATTPTAATATATECTSAAAAAADVAVFAKGTVAYDSLAVRKGKLVAALSSLEGATWGGALHLHSAKDGAFEGSYDTETGAPSVCWVDDDLVAYACDSGDVKVVAVGSGGSDLMTEALSLEEHDSTVSSCSTNGSVLASTSWDATVKLWDFKQAADAPQSTVTYQGHCGRVMCSAWSGEHLLATGSEDLTLRLWDTRGEKAALKIQAPSPVTAVACSPTSESQVVLGLEDGSVLVYDTKQTGSASKTLTPHTGLVTALNFSAAGVLASGSEDTSVRVYKADYTGIASKFSGHTDYVRDVAWLDDKTLLSCSWDFTVLKWASS